MGNSSATDHLVDLAGRRLHYRQWGPSLAHPIVLVHGYPGHTHVWEKFAEMVSKSRDDRVIAVDLSGHGESDWAESYSFAQWVGDLHAMALALELPRFTMIGHSLGSTLGFCFADAHPAMLDHLIAVDGLPPGSWEPTTPNAGALPRSFSSLAECAAFLGIDLATLPAESITGSPSYLVKPDGRGGFVWRHDLAVRDALLRELRHDEDRWRAAAARSRVRITYLRCGLTHVGSYDATAAILRHFLTCELIDLPNAAHSLPTKDPELLAATVLKLMT